MPPVYSQKYGLVNVPEGATEEQIVAAFVAAERARPKPPPDSPPPAPPREEPGLIRQGIQNVGGLLKGLPAGAIQGIAAIPEGIGAVTDSDTLKDVGRWMRENEASKYLSEVSDWEKQADGTANYGRQAGEIIGNLATMFIPVAGQLGKAGQVATGLARYGPRAASLGLSALQQAAEVSRDVDQKRAAGMEISRDDAQSAARYSTLAAGLDVLPLHRLNRFLPGAAKREGLHLIEDVAKRSFTNKAGEVGISALAEGITEPLQQLWSNYVKREAYNPQQQLDEGLMQNAIAGGGAGAGLEVMSQIMLTKWARRAHANANRVKGANSPEIPQNPVQDALGIRTVAGQQENSYIPQAEQPFLEKVSQVMYGKRLQDLPQGNAANLQRNIALMQQKGMTDPEILQYLSQDVDITAAPAAQSEPPPSRPAPLDLSNQPITLNDEGGFTSPYQDQPSLLDTIIAGGQQAPNYGEDIVAGMLNRRPRPGYPAPKPAMPDVRLTDEGTIIDPAKLPTKIRRGYPEPVKPPAEPANLFNTLPPVEPQQRMVFDPATDSYRVVSSEPPIAPDSLPPLPPVPYSPPVSTTPVAPVAPVPVAMAPTLAPVEPVLPPVAPPAVRPVTPGATWQDGDKLRIRTEDLSLAPTELQYKIENVGRGGASGSLDDIAAWDDDAAGTMFVWKNPATGKTLVVNGHNRYAAAVRLGQPDVGIKFIDAKDAKGARIVGALQNIREGKGTAIDAAKFMRDSEMTIADLKAAGVTLKGALATDGAALANLAPSLFHDVVHGNLKQDRAVIIGEGLNSYDDQKVVLKLADQKKATNAELKEMIRLALAEKQEIAESRASKPVEGKPVEEEYDLFGNKIGSEPRTTIYERSQLSSYIQKRIGQEGKIFGMAGTESNAQRLGRAGNEIKAEVNREIADQANQALEAYNKETRYSGDITNLLRQGAERIANGEKPIDVQESIYAAVRESLAKTVALRKPTDIRKGDAEGDRGSDKGVQENPRIGTVDPQYSIDPTTPGETIASLKDRLDDSPLLKRIYAATKRFGLEDRVSTRLVDDVRNPDGTLRTGTPGSYFEKIITLAMADPDAMESTLNHEMVHAIKEIGMLTDAEWTMLKTGLNPNAILDDNQREEYTKLYRGNQDMIHEEAIAIGIQKYMRGDIDLPPEIRSIVGQKLGFLENLGRIFRGEGHTTPETVMQSIADGTIGRRQYANQPKPNVQTGSTTAVPGAAGSSPKPKGAANIGDWVKANAPKEEVDPKYSYVGSKAYSQDERESLQRASSKDVAIQMDAAGKSAKETRLATGWFKSPYDKVWKQEVTDHTSKLTEEFANLPESEIFGKENEMRLDHALDHPELFRAYPELRKVKVIKQTGRFGFFGGLQGSFNPETNTLNVTPNAKDPASTMLHEIQHWIQEKEGFATGGNESIAVDALTPERMRKIAGELLTKKTAELETHAARLSKDKKALAIADQYREDIEELDQYKEKPSRYNELESKLKQKIFGRLPSEDWRTRYNDNQYFSKILRANRDDIERAQDQLIDRQKQIAAIRSGDPETLKKIIESSGGAFTAYQSIAGEIEARDVQARRAYTPEERGATDPMSSEAFDSDDVITVFGKNKSDSVEASDLSDEAIAQRREDRLRLKNQPIIRFNQDGLEKVRSDKDRSYYKAVADFVAEQYPGTTISESKSTESVYIYNPAWEQPIRLSHHAKYGSNQPLHIQRQSYQGMGERLDRGIRAAYTNAGSYSTVKQWDSIIRDQQQQLSLEPGPQRDVIQTDENTAPTTIVDRFQQAYNKLAEFDGQVVTAAAIQKEMGIADRAEFIKLLDELDRGKGIAADGSTLSLPASTGTKSATRGGASPVYQSGDTSFYGIRFHKPADAHLNEPRYSIDKSPDPDGLHAKIYGTDKKPPLLQRIKDFVQKPDRALKFRQAVLNQNESVDRLSAKSEFHANPDTSSSNAIADIKRAKQIADQILLTGRGLIYGEKGHEVFRAIANSRLSPFGKDGWYTGIIDKNKKKAFEITMNGRREEHLANTPNYTPGPNAAEAIAMAKELYANDADIREAVDRQSEFNDTMVDMALRGGVIDEATAKKFKDSRHFAFYRKTEDDYNGISGGNSGGSIGGRQNFKTIKGSDAEINDPINNLVRNTYMIVDMAMKTVGKQKIARDAVNADAATVVPRAIAGETVPVRFDGKEYHFKITDKLLYESLNVAALPQGLLMNVGRGGSDLLRTFVTHTPVYLLNNAMKDSMEVWARGYTTIPYLNILTDFRKVKKGNAAYDDMLAHGSIGEGILGSGGDKEVDLHIKDMIGQGNFLHKANRWMKERIAKSETLSRVTVYESVIKKGGTPAEARQQARELLNFDRRGAWVGVRILSAFVPFQNARWQGTDALYRNATGSAAGDSARMARTMIARMAYLSAASALYTAVASTLDAWKKATQEERDQNWFIPIGNGNALRVPIPFELGLLTKIVPERTMAWMMGHDEGKEFAGALGRAVRETLKIDIIPQVIKPGLEAVANYDFYRGKAIENSADKRIERGYRAGDYTSELARIIGETTTLSPIQIDHMLKGYFGSSSVFATQIVDFALRDKAGPDIRLDDPTTLPLFGRMFQPQLGGKDIAAFYEMREAAEQAYATLMQHQKTGEALSDSERARLGKAAGIEQGTRGADQQMAALHRIRKHLQASKQMTSTQRYDALKANKEAQDRVATQVLEAVKRAR